MNRLVPSPVFVLCPIRSGSTLLRCILNSHSRICAPHELHVADLEVDLTTTRVQLGMTTAGLSGAGLEHLLWDRVLHQQLRTSGKDVVVDKTPGNLLLWRRLRDCWPEARFVFLRRHPARILASALAGRSGDQTADHVTNLVLRYLELMDEAAQELPGHQVTYESLVRDPAKVVAELCEQIGVGFEPGMLEYGRSDHGPFVFGIGDFGSGIRSGRVLDGEAGIDPATIPDQFRAATRRWGYPTA
ncbi:MAG: sulfotransferase family protein [Dermatophilaceae bacterium]